MLYTYIESCLIKVNGTFLLIKTDSFVTSNQNRVPVRCCDKNVGYDRMNGRMARGSTCQTHVKGILIVRFYSNFERKTYTWNLLLEQSFIKILNKWESS